KNNAPGGVIAVVDEGGNLMALERLDGTFAAGANISIGKARTAVLFKRPTKAFEDIIKNGRTAMVALPDAYFTPLQGGVPITVDGQIVGGVGVSGASSAQQDEELAMAGAGVFSAEMKTSRRCRQPNHRCFSSMRVRSTHLSRRVRCCWTEQIEIIWFTPVAATNRGGLRFTRWTPTSFMSCKARPLL